MFLYVSVYVCVYNCMLVRMFVVSVCECVSMCVYVYMCLSGRGLGLCGSSVSRPVFEGGGLYSPYITSFFDTPFKQAPLGAGMILGMGHGGAMLSLAPTPSFPSLTGPPLT